MAVEWHLALLYRGPLRSCNYACSYCPFAKTHADREALRRDAASLSRFVGWVRGQQDSPRRLGILFTPWGEALIRRPYRDALLALGHMPHVARVAVQTNLSGDPTWLAGADRDATALWCTYHPTQTSRAAFVARCQTLADLGIRHSVGVVGLKQHFDDIAALRRELAPHVYLWVNAYKRERPYYTVDDLHFLRRIDPLFDLNNRVHASTDAACLTGEQVITVDGAGDVRRCHFVDGVLGNLYRDDLDTMLRPRTCPGDGCGCHIGYVHLQRLNLHGLFAGGVLERIPAPGAELQIDTI